MSSIDNDPPKHADIGSLTHPERLSIYNRKRSLLNARRKRCLYFSLEEIRVLILKEGIVPRSGHFSRKGYTRALEIQERAQKYLEEEKQQKNDNDLTV
ncbi:MAG: hypothetical protein IJ358_00305 [Clostridia bacterium]|nr:hypothetical protein [Clostridia bacterium]